MQDDMHLEALDEDHAALAFAAQKDAALCTIVGIDGSFSRRLGAQLAIAKDGCMAGSLSDGCLEKELAAQTEITRLEGRPAVLRYGQGSPFIDFRLPCGAGLDILVDPAPDRTALRGAVANLTARKEAQLDLAVTGPGLLARRQYVPALRILLLGVGPEVEALVRLAAVQGISVEHRRPGEGLTLGQAPANAVVDAWTAILCLFHDHEWEAAILDWALKTPACYIGAQGGAPARTARLEMLAALGHNEQARGRIVSPVGLIPKVRDPRILALSALAEMVACHDGLRE